MKLTCLSEGNGFYNPPCHILQLCGFSLLFECPLDLSSLVNFSPIPIVDSSNGTNNLLRSVPQYNTVRSLDQCDVSLIDMVLISSPYSLLGLPFLTRKLGFSKSTKIYATEATVRIGQLMMEDIVSMNMEYVNYYGPAKTSALSLYNAVEIKDSIQKIHTLKFGEEVCFNGMLMIKALSSGLDIGSCNWSIKSPKRSIAYLSSSIFGSVCAMEFDYTSLSRHDLVLFSDSSTFSSMDHDSEITMSGENEEGNGTGTGTSEELIGTNEIEEESEKMRFVCSCIVDSVRVGGSVLIPLGRIAILTYLLEHIFNLLDSLNMKVPIFIISEKAEEMLTFTNAVPEWLCKQRQEKLFCGEALFRHVELIKEGRISLHRTLYSTNLLEKWEEPCIVISPHWSLRLGSVVPLLCRWHSNPKSLLVLEEGVDAELALLPFQQVEMKVLQCSFLSGIKMKKLSPLFEELQPKTVLLPESLRTHYRIKSNISHSLQYYSQTKTTDIQISRHEYDAYLSTNLAFQLQPTKLSENNNNMAAARLKGKLVLRNGVYLLTSLNKPLIGSNNPVLKWGNVDPVRLMLALNEREFVGSISRNDCVEGVEFSIGLTEPIEALIRARGNEIVISCTDERVSVLICEALSSVCNGI